jgi:hypothetical protein
MTRRRKLRQMLTEELEDMLMANTLEAMDD